MRTTLVMALVALALLLGGCSSQGSTAQTTAATSHAATSSAPPQAGSATTLPGSPTPTLAPSSTASPPSSEVATMSPEPFSLTSTAFKGGGAIPRRFTCDGDDVSPDLSWTGAPDATKALVLEVIDPDARDFVHWIVYDMTGTPTGRLPLGVSASPGAPPQGTNSFGRRGYGGPCPPSGTHHYRFTLSALDAVLEITGAPRIDALKSAMAGHVLAVATLIGTYHRG